VQGLLIVALPIAVSPVASIEVANGWLGLLRRDPFSITAETNSAQGAWFSAAIGLAGSLGFLIDQMVRREWRLARIEETEVALLVAVLVLLHPLFGLGIYFLAWHSLRHVVKLSGVWSEGQPSPWVAIGRVHLKANAIARSHATGDDVVPQMGFLCGA